MYDYVLSIRRSAVSPAGASGVMYPDEHHGGLA